ncbi:(2,3-dihydroxybenzoyl)adenylate synthase [Chloroflexota bacterium]
MATNTLYKPVDGFTPYEPEAAEKYTRLRWWLGITLGNMFDKAADLYPNKEAIVDDRVRLTYCQLREKVDRLAIGLMKLGIEPTDRVLLQLPNWGEFVYSYFAFQKIGAIVVLMLPGHSQLEISHFANLTGAKAWIVPHQYRKTDYLPIINSVLQSSPSIKYVISARAQGRGEFATDIDQLISEAELTRGNLSAVAKRSPKPAEVCHILPTGGTTGLPKTAPRTHNDYISNVEYHARAWELNNNDICLVSTPVGHNLGLLAGITGTIFTYGKIILLDSTRPEDFCSAVQREKVTCAPMVPALVQRVINLPGLIDYDLSSLVKIYAGGAPSLPELVRSIYEKLGCKFVNAFGMVEGPCCMTRLDDDFNTICNTIGRPCCPYEDFKVIDQDGNTLPPNTEGELVAKGPGIFTGYFMSDNKSVFTEDGFLMTGDLAIIDEAEHVKITGRIKDIILRGGENISAVEIEDLIMSNPAVEDVSVIGMPDKDLGEKACAYIKPVAGQRPSLEDIVSYMKGIGSSTRQLPERIELIDEIPLTNAGKHDKKALREDIKKRLSLA